jgi:hypothetical protein
MAQTTENDKTSALLKQYGNYFEQAEWKQNTLTLVATSYFFNLEHNIKDSLLGKTLSGLDIDLVNICYGKQQELWRKSGVDKFDFIKAWNMDNFNEVAEKIMPKEQKTTRYRPWFYYLGIAFNTGGLIGEGAGAEGSFTTDFRIGCFMVGRVWDFSFSFSYTNVDYSEEHILNYGGMTKFYIPIRKANLMPFFGGGVSYRMISSVSYEWNGSIYGFGLAGISWFVWKGSLDLAVQFNTSFMLTIGYTFSPWSDNTPVKKRK